MRILVTGGAGFVGSTTAQRLIESGHQVVVVDTMLRGYRQAVPEGAELAVGDMGDREFMEAHVARPAH